MDRVAVVGLGAMGAPMARRLVAGGYGVVVWNRSPERTEEFARSGVEVAATPAEAARGAEAVVVMVRDPRALREVTEGHDGIAAGATPGSVVIQMSTVDRPTLRRLHIVLPEGVELLDAPVLGSISEAESGTLRVFVGGSADLVARCQDLLGVLGTPVHVGECGSGTAAKLVANSVLLGVVGVLGEALALSRAQGLGDEDMFEVLDATPLAEQARRRRHAVETGDHPVRFALDLASKDAALILGAAGERGLYLPIADAVATWLAAASEAGHGDADYSTLLAHIRDSAPPPPPSL